MGLGKTYSTKYLVDSNGNTGAANQVLVSTATGVDWVDGSGSVIIGGPYLPLAGGTITGNLTVNGTANIGNQLTFPYGSIGDYIYHTGDGDTFYGFPSNDSFKVATAGSDRLYINSSGNVGIGTTAPTSALTVYPTEGVGTNLVVGLFRKSSSNNGGSNIVRLAPSFGTTYLDLEQNDSGTGPFRYGTYGDSNIVATNKLHFVSGTTLAMSVTAGNVGIGTTSPTFKLDVSGTARINTTSTTLIKINSTGSGTVGRSLIQIIRNDGVEKGWDFGTNVFKDNSDNFTFREVGGTGDGLTRILIQKVTGKVGIATTAPSEQLHVSGNVRITGAIYGSSNTPGTSGQVLTSTVTGTNWVGASGLPGGPYLPLAAGAGSKLTSDLYIDTTIRDTNAEIVIRRSSNIIRLGSGSVSDVINAYSGGQIALTLDTSQNATFAGKITSGNDIVNATAGVYTWTGDTDTYIQRSAANEITFKTQALNALVLDSSQNATFSGDVNIINANLSNQEGTIAIGTTTVASVSSTTYNSMAIDYVVKNGLNLRSGTIIACHDGTNTVYTETSTPDIGSTTDITFAVAVSGADFKLEATVLLAGWTVKTLVRAL